MEDHSEFLHSSLIYFPVQFNVIFLLLAESALNS